MSDRFFDQHQRETVSAALARMSSAGQPAVEGEAVAVAADLLDRYLSGTGPGYPGPDDRTHVLDRGLDIMRQKYLDGITELDRRSRSAFGTHFTGLTGDQQDRMLADLEEVEDGPEPADGQVAAGVMADGSSPDAAGLAELGFLPLLAMHARPAFLAGVTPRPPGDLTTTG